MNAKCSPQAENGHVDIANEIAEALCRTQLSGHESRVLWALLRKTYGWHKKTDNISLTQFQAITGLPVPKISDTLQRLQRRNMITITENGKGKVKSYGFQKVFTLWRVLPFSVTPKKGISFLPSGITENGKGEAASNCFQDVFSQNQVLPKTGIPENGITENGITENGVQVLPKTGSTKETITKEKNIYSNPVFFEALWEVYPLKDGKKAALKHFQATVKNETDEMRIDFALENYLRDLEENNWKKPKNGSTWFNNWQDWIPADIDELIAAETVDSARG